MRQSKTHYSPDPEYLMLLCRPFCSRGEFTSVVITAVYVPAHASIRLATEEPHHSISQHLSAQPDSIVKVARDDDRTNLKSVLLKFYESEKFPTREKEHLSSSLLQHFGCLQNQPPATPGIICLSLSAPCMQVAQL